MLRRIKPNHPWLRPENYINGQWVTATNNYTAPVAFPAAGNDDKEPLGHIANSTAVDAKAAVDAAHAAFPGWANELASKRAKILRDFGDRLRYHSDDLTELLAAESGKILSDARGEIAYAASFADWYAGEAERVNGMVLQPFRPGVRPIVLKKPVGVVATILPWNLPAALLCRSVCGALAAGCTAVVKPSDLTPYTAVAVASLLEEVGMPAGVFNVVQTKDPAIVSDAWNEDRRVRKICFTGSVRVGKLLAKNAVHTMKRVKLELGGNAPFIVFEDADLDLAVKMFFAAKFRNGGQTCVCPNRILVHESIEKEFADRIVAEMVKFKVGNSLKDESVTTGPLITQGQRNRVHGLVERAKEQGAKVLCGGTCLNEIGPNFYAPTVLDNVTPRCEIYHQEIFGPVIPIIPFKSYENAMHMSNEVDVGLAAYAFTKDHKRLWALADDLHFGMVGLNETMISASSIPFGGVKDSGIGRDGGPTGIDNFLDLKYVCKGLY